MSNIQTQQVVAQLNEPFMMYLLKNFHSYCTNMRLIPNISNLMNFLLRHKLFNLDTIRHYVVLNDYEAWLESPHYANKTQTIKAIAERYGLHENTIWNILKDHKNKFE